jgi:transcriptional regulator GlxA family with amidase domain
MTSHGSLAKSDRRPHRVAMLAYDNAQILDITGPLEVFARTSRWLIDQGLRRTPCYEISLLGERRGSIKTSGGLKLEVSETYRNAGPIDTLLISGGIGCEREMKNEDLLEWIRRRSKRVARLGSICTGALILAAAGLLKHRPATTHWAYFDRLGEIAPDAIVNVDAIYVKSGRVYTSAGVTAGMDMALAMVEEDCGRPVALAVAQALVMFLKRPGGQSQFSRHLAAQSTRDERLGELELWILNHLERPLTVPELATRASMSSRHFARRFAAEIGVTPAEYVARARIDAARRLLEETRLSMKEVATRCGFSEEQNLRRAFVNRLKVTPTDYRQRVQG